MFIQPIDYFLGTIRNRANERGFTVVVWTPGTESTIAIDVIGRSAVISTRRMDLWERIAYLHKSPGPHLVAIRGNWVWTRVWRWLADGTAYLQWRLRSYRDNGIRARGTVVC